MSMQSDNFDRNNMFMGVVVQQIALLCLLYLSVDKQLAASIDFSPLWDLKCILKSAGHVDAKLHWLHLFDFSPLCIVKCVLKWSARKDA